MAVQDKIKLINQSDQTINFDLFLFTVNHKTAPVAIREKFSIPEYKLKDATNELKNYKSLDSFLILSTCNRTEIYFTTVNFEKAISDIYSFLSKFLNLEETVIKEYNSLLTNSKVVEHSFKLASGLDSLVMGEKQILSQVRFAYSNAQAEKTLNNTLELLFQNVINTSKDIHKETNLSKNSQSISSAAIDMANEMCNSIKTKSVMVLGAGKMAELALDHIEKIGGAEETVVLNRSPHRVIEFSDKYKIDKSIPFEDVYESINDSDIIITATGAPHFILFAEQFKPKRKDVSKPLYIFDISLPRNVDPEFGKLENVTLIDIDSLQSFYNKNNSIPKEDMDQVKKIISAGIKTFQEEISNKEVSEVIRNLKAKVNSTIEDKLNKLKGNKETFTAEELDYIVNNIANTILHEPIKNLKDPGYKEEKIQVIKDLFEV
jgi:glutamyl-tRNA reductase